MGEARMMIFHDVLIKDSREMKKIAQAQQINDSFDAEKGEFVEEKRN